MQLTFADMLKMQDEENLAKARGLARQAFDDDITKTHHSVQVGSTVYHWQWIVPARLTLIGTTPAKFSEPA